MPHELFAESTRDAFCPGCSALVPHYWEGVAFLPAPHEAPCGQQCPVGGVGTTEWMLDARIHRPGECAACEEDED